MSLLDIDLNKLVAGCTWRHPQKVYLQVGMEKLVPLKPLLIGINDTVLGSNISLGII